MSVSLQSRNVRSRRAVGMCEITALGDFQGLWEEGETGQFHRPVFHAFHQAVISTAACSGGKFAGGSVGP